MTFQDKIQDLLVLAVAGVLGLVIFGIVYEQFVPESNYTFGPALYIVAVGLILMLVISFIRKTTNPLTKLQRDDWIILVLALLVVLAIFFYVPTLIPDSFSIASTELASIVGVS